MISIFHRTKALGVTAVALTLLFTMSCRKEAARGGSGGAKRGPVVVISIDTLRADHLPIYGYDAVKTPNLDALAADGMVFDSAWSHVPLTLPSHVSMLTGKLPAEHGVRSNIGYRFDAAAHETIPALLKKNGYATGAAVSAYVLRSSSGVGAAFDQYDDAIDSGEGGVVGELQRAGGRTVAAAKQWIEARGGESFFLMLHLFEPHAPYEAPEPFRTIYAARPYDGEIAAVDAEVGSFLEFLKEKNLYDSSTIILMSDHGEGLGDHGESQHGIFLYSEAIRVPLVVKLPGSSRRGERVTAPVQLIDIFPTVADVTGIDEPPGLAGSSLLEVADGKVPERRIFSETMYPRIHLGLSDLASLVDTTHHDLDAPRAELYELATDRGETTNVLADERRVTASMREAMKAFDRRLAAPSNINAEDAAKLAALGYLSAPVQVGDDTALGDPKDHIQDLEKAGEAARLIDAGRSEEAIVILRGAVERNPKFADGWSLLGRAYERSGRPEESIAAFRKTIEISPMIAPDSAITLAESYLSLERFDESIEHAKLGLVAHPAAAHEVLGKVYLAQKDLAAAEKEATWLMNDPSRRVQGMVLMARIRLAQKRPDDALSLVSSARLDLESRGAEPVPMLAFVQGDALARKGRIDEAQQEFAVETQRFPRNREAYVRLAALQILQGKVSEAEQTFGRMASANPSPSSYALAADTFSKFGLTAIAARWQAKAR